MRPEGFGFSRRHSSHLYRILVVEDDLVQARVLSELLTAQRFEVVTASSTSAAREILEEMQPDLFLIDANLEEPMQGLRFVQEIHASNELATCVVMSADRDRATSLAALEAGADEYLQKPLSFGELSIRIQNMLQLVDLREQALVMAKRLSREKEILTKYFSKKIVESILDDTGPGQTSGRYVTTTVMVYDLRNSTGLAENMTTVDFANMINQITVDLIELVGASGGNIVKLTGDGFIATFSDTPELKGAVLALGCAGRIEAYQQDMAFVLAGMGVELSGFGIGIGTGRVFEGNIGNFKRMEFAIVGDALERARRLENLTKKAGKAIIVDSVTRRFAPDSASFEPIRVSVSGRSTEVYAVRRADVLDLELLHNRGQSI